MLFRSSAALTFLVPPLTNEVSLPAVFSCVIHLVVSLSVIRVAVDPCHNLLSDIFDSFETVVGRLKDIADIFEVFKAITHWKDQNQDKPLPSVASMRRFLDGHNTAPASPATITVPANFMLTYRLDYDALSDDDEDEPMLSAESAAI